MSTPHICYYSVYICYCQALFSYINTLLTDVIKKSVDTIKKAFSALLLLCLCSSKHDKKGGVRTDKKRTPT